MKTSFFSPAATVALVLASFVASGCMGPRQLDLTPSPDVSAVRSTAKLTSASNGATQIDLAVQHLAMPAHVTPGANVFVVWVRGDQPGARAQNIGTLAVDQHENAKLVATTPLKTFELYVTAEPSTNAAAPTGESLLYTDVTR